MCYAFSLLEPDAIAIRYAASFPADWHFTPTYFLNAFEFPSYPVLTNLKEKEFQLMQWGLIPFWVKTKKDAESIRKKTINARADTIFDKPSYRYAVEKRRCIIPSDGFFEWRYYNGKNYPYYIYLIDHEMFSFAGIWEEWHDSESNQITKTFSMITCDANPLLRKIHNKKKRMPVILKKDQEDIWLKPELSQDEIHELLVPFPEEQMQAHTISKRVTSRTQKRNVKESIKPVQYPELPRI